MPYIALRRTDIPAGSLFIEELQPNTSQRNASTDAPGQTKYARRPDVDTVVTSGAGPIVTVGSTDGIAAYLIDNVEDTQNANAALTAAFANTISTTLVAILDAGGALTLAAVNTAIQASTGGAVSLIGGDSTATLAELLDVITGAVYTLPAGSAVEDAANDFTDIAAGSFNGRRHISESGAFNISRGAGRLSTLIAATYSYDGTAAAAITLYDDDGLVLS